MKRVIRHPSKYYHEVGFDAFKHVNPTRLKLIAAVAIEFTALEAMVDYAVRTLLGLFEDTEVVSRINGFDGKVGIIKNMTQRSSTLRGVPAELIASTLGEAGVLKTYRDAVIHANFHHPKATLVQTSIKQGKPYEVDVSIATLRALYRRIYGIEKEMVAALRVIEHHFDQDDLESHGYSDARDVITSKVFQRHLDQLRKRQASRKFLPKVRKLAEERSTPSGKRRAEQIPQPKHGGPRPQNESVVAGQPETTE